MTDLQLDGLRDVTYQEDSGIATITLNNPDRLNALSTGMLESLPAIWQHVKGDPAVRVIILTGTGRGFCSGMDVKQAAEGAGPETRRSAEGSHRDLGITAMMNDVWKPVITAVNGTCAGAGLQFVADSDIVICGEGATFLDTHVFVGQVAATEFVTLARRIPFEAVMRMILVGRNERVSASRALELGLVSEIVPVDELMPRAREIAGWICEASPATVQKSKKVMWESLSKSLEQALEDGNRVLRGHWQHPDYAEGIAAFAEGRKPAWETGADKSDGL